jgi:class 3 adenylate cyclase
MSSRSERRIVTALFCDVVGSTSIAERLDPEEWVEILDEAFTLIATPVARYEGTLVRLLGDALLAYFGAPVTHEDDPERAILAGLEIVEALVPFRERISNEFAIEFEVRIGISTGEAIVGAMAIAPFETTALGDAVNVAARLQQGAQPGSILISKDTLRQVTGLFEVENVGEVELKGKQELVHAFRVLRYCPPVRLLRGRRHPDNPLVGRDREMDQLDRALQSVRSGRGQLVLITGEAGIGKTRLIDETYRAWSAGDEYGDWVEARAISYDVLRPYGVFHQLLRQFEFDATTVSASLPSIGRPAGDLSAGQHQFVMEYPS